MLNVKNNAMEKSKGLSPIHDKFDSESTNHRINELNDIENALDLIRSGSSDSFASILKIKALFNLFIKARNTNYILAKCLDSTNERSLIRTGSYNYYDYRVTSIRSKHMREENIAILIKYFPTFGYMQNRPGTIRSISFKQLVVNEKKQDNCLDVTVLGNFGKEYSVKINFFTYN